MTLSYSGRKGNSPFLPTQDKVIILHHYLVCPRQKTGEPVFGVMVGMPKVSVDMGMLIVHTHTHTHTHTHLVNLCFYGIVIFRGLEYEGSLANKQQTTESDHKAK